MNYVLKPEAAQKIEAYIAEVRKVNGASNPDRAFTVAPTVAQGIEMKIQESSDFLRRISIVSVDEEAGEKIGIGIADKPIAYRTAGERSPTDPTSLDADGYQCRKTNFDTTINYRQIDQWANHPTFQTIVRDAIIARCALDRIMIGWNGTHAAADTDQTANPLLQDVNIGWIQKLRIAAPARVMSEAVPGVGKVRIGLTGDYIDISSLVYDLINNIIDPWHRNGIHDDELVVIMGRNLTADRLFPIVNAPKPPSEKIASDIIIRFGKAAGLPIVSAPFFPENSLLITSFNNLAIYWQAGTRRRRIIDNPARDRIEDYQSVNEAYVIEDMGKCAFVENIQFV